ncbi:MAG TPA: cyanophycinase [Candidatus Limnocylindrales bacterium]|nr:cyanophycinase [Candidatus Limnocylindrales bacterium]
MPNKISLRRTFLMAIAAICLSTFASPAHAKWKYLRAGNAADSTVRPLPGYALMGGGGKQDAALLWLCERANGGDFLVLSARDDDAYLEKTNAKIKAICPLNSVATLSFFGREDSSDPEVVRIIDQAEAIYLNGGDQSDYVRFWQDTPVQDALNRHIAAGKPIGGSSAGLAVLAEFSFASMIDTIHSPEALANPYGNKVTLSSDFLRIPLLAETITDTHFVKRDRLGRLLVFMARILQDGWAKQIRAVAVDENSALLVESNGSARVVGEGTVYFLDAGVKPEVCAYRQPLTFTGINVHRATTGKTFQLKKWEGEADAYSLAVKSGVVQASGSSHGIY